MRLAHVEAAVLAGGQSSRMGRDKATLEVGGRPLVERVADALGACVERVSVVVRPGQVLPCALPRIEDARPERAPIAGLEAALAAARCDAVLVAACDLPELDPRVVLALLALVPARGAPPAVAPEGPGGLEPLLAVYHRSLLETVRARLAQGRLSLRGLLDEVETVRVPTAELALLDPGLRSLHNANRPEDLPRAPAP